MKKTKLYALSIFAFLIFIGSTNLSAQDSQTSTKFDSLISYIESNGNFAQSDLESTIISAPEINDNVKNKKYLVLDIRSKDWFAYGHIQNAKNVDGPGLLNYFQKNIVPADYDKITVVCYSGQSAAYYAGLLRLAGYNNVYILKWGMSSWIDELAVNIWKKNSTNNFAANLETKVNATPEKGKTPTITTGKIEGKEILMERVKEAFAKPYKDFIVKAETVFENPNEYFIVNYVDADKYNFGHIPGSVNYLPNASLTSTTDLYTLPTSKKVLVNCTSGQLAAYTVAYLNVLGYDVYNLGYGSNSYMNTVLKEKNWNGFSQTEINNFSIVE